MKNYDYTNLKALREEKGLTQDDMGRKLGITQSAYNKLETGNRKRKSDSILDIEKLAEALELSPPRLISILTDQNDVQASGIKESDLWQIHRILKKEPLREDEFVFFTTELLDPDKYDYRDKYNRMELDSEKDLENFPIWEYPPTMHIMIADTVEIGNQYNKEKEVDHVSVWLANKKIGTIPRHYTTLVHELTMQLMISRVLLIENDEGVPGYVDTYMKVVFIASNSVCKSAKFEKGRFSKIRLMTKEEIEETDNHDEE